jgi:ABC-2 type transport system permease protein
MNWWRFLLASELRKILVFRSDFWITFVGQTLVQILIARALWVTIFASQEASIMEGFTLPMMTLYYVIVPIGNRILTGQNMGFLSREIYDGTFSRYLLYPISFFQYKSLSYLAQSFFYSGQLLLVLFLYSFLDTGITLELPQVLLGLVLFLLAAVVYLMLSLSIELLALWVDNIWSLMVMCRFTVNFLGGALIPLAFLPDAFEGALQFTPFPYLVSFPVRTIMGLTSLQEILQGALILVVWIFFFLGVSKFIWRRGQHLYTGVGI